METPTQERLPENTRLLLKKIEAREPIPESSRIAIVVAHPDDEVIGFGAQIQLIPECTIVHVTDGTPDTEDAWMSKGYGSTSEYKATRAHELKTALSHAKHNGPQINLDIPDQKVAQQVLTLIRRLLTICEEKNIRYIMTHAYERGHPDHDAIALAVHTVKKILTNKVNIVEAPFYHSGVEGKTVWQEFTPSPVPITTLKLTPEEQAQKKILYAAHASQAEAVAHASIEHEQIREAPEYNFCASPHAGPMHHLYSDSGLDASSWNGVVRQIEIATGVTLST